MPSMNFLQQQPDDDDGLGPLPPKWEKAYTENGETYFIDHNTGTSHWLDPRLSKFQKKSLEDCMDDELPYGWEKIHDPQYGTYFIDHVNRRTQYENPVLEAKRRNSERKTNGANQSASSKSLNDELMMRQNESQSQQQQQQQQHHQHQQQQIQSEQSQLKPNLFTKNPSELRGERINTTLLKSSRGLGFTIVGGDDNIEEFLQIKSIVANGPAWLDGKLQTGDILVYVNDTCVLGFTHHEMVNVFQSILPGETVTLEVCRGYPLPFDPNDPNNEVVTTIAVDGINSDPEKSRMLMDLNMDGNYNFLDMSDTQSASTSAKHNSTLSRLESSSVRSDISENFANESKRDLISSSDKPEILNISIVKGPLGFGFTIADSAYGQKVKKILDRNCCKELNEGDYLLAINNTNVMYMSHSAVVQVLKNCPKSEEAILKIQRGSYFNGGNISDKPTSRVRRVIDSIDRAAIMNGNASKEALNLYRSKTPTADLYSTQTKEILPIRSKTPLVDTRSRAKTPMSELNGGEEEVDGTMQSHNDGTIHDLKNIAAADTKSNNSFPDQDSINNEAPFIDPFPKLVLNLSDRLAEASLGAGNHYQTKDLSNIRHNHFDSQPNLNNFEQNSVSSGHDFYVNYNSNLASGYTNSPSNSIYAASANTMPTHMKMPLMAPMPTYHHEHCYCFECQRQYRYHNILIDRRKVGFSPLDTHAPMASPHPIHMNQPQSPQHLHQAHHENNYWTKNDMKIQQQENFGYMLSEVTLERQTMGFGFRIVGGTEEGSQVTVGHIVEGGAAYNNPRIETGDEILSIDGHNVVQSSHHRVVELMSDAAQRGRVTMILRRRVHDPNIANLQHLQHHSHHQHVQHPHLQRDFVYPYDVIVVRNENESFGFVIISASNQYYSSTIGKLIPGSPADRCDELKVGDRIIAVNGINIAGMSHGDVVNLIKESGLHVRLTIGNPKETLQSNSVHTQPINPNNNLNDPYFEHRNNGLVSITNDNLNVDVYQPNNH
ncbi:membrane-associated guanylate kinase, WW and PDZ domain-containing protein 1 isoform X2 [Contarinia nasturtii]|nr:membrane-associated guanylate kinase, WW and PDZ domain-containing protein 1 isoform X2 [Contarinia nasturtii]